MSRAFWRRLRRQDDDAGVSFAWPRDTDLTAEQIRIAMRESAASPSQPEAGRTVVTTAHDAPPPQQWQPGPTPVFGPGPSMPMRSLSNDNHDRVWIAQGDHVEAMGVGDTPQEAVIEYARAVADLLRPVGGPDAFDDKPAIRRQLAACRGECGDWPPDYSEWSR